jgi:UV DNA damage repair endonuclease
MIVRLGYTCINTTLSKKVKVNRKMVKKTFLEKGIEGASKLAL